MSVLIQKVSTGDVVVFDKAARDLILIDHENSLEFDRSGGNLEAASKLLAAGKAKKFDRRSLEKIQAALVGVVLLV